MCTVIIGWNVHPLAPLIVAANRDEFYARPTLPPARLPIESWAFGGQDKSAGGTWMGITRWGIVGLTNYPTQTLLPGARSRGQLVLDALAQGSALEAIEQVHKPVKVPYAPYNLFAADLTGIYVTYHRATDDLSSQVAPDSPEGADVRADLPTFDDMPSGALSPKKPLWTQPLYHLEPGWHVLPNGFADDQRIHKVKQTFKLLEGIHDIREEGTLVRRLQQILADHTLPEVVPDRPAWLPEPLRNAVGALCVHSPLYGTRSHSVVLMDGEETRLYHAEGKPCEVPLQPICLD